nr:unnamed protein product [Callosobruchus analis]
MDNSPQLKTTQAECRASEETQRKDKQLHHTYKATFNFTLTRNT